MKEELSRDVVHVRRKSDRVMRTIRAYGPQRGRPDTEKVYDEMASEWDLGSSSEITFCLRISRGMWENTLRLLKCAWGEWNQVEKCGR